MIEDRAGETAPAKGKRKQPRWVVPFLRALERTGQVRAAALDAGIDWSTVYARKRAHANFAAACAEALKAHAERKRREEDDEIAALKDMPSPGSPAASPTSPASGRGEVVISAGKVRRVGRGRWSAAREKIFFEELAATANLGMAAAAVGISTNAIHARLLKHRVFAAKFEAVMRSAGATIDLYLIEETRKSFDPKTIDTGDVKPKVSIDQAIKISQLNARKRKEEEQEPNPFAEEAAAMDEDAADALRQHILDKLRRLRLRDMPEMLAQGWSFDEEYDLMVPPGWVRAETADPKLKPCS